MEIELTQADIDKAIQTYANVQDTIRDVSDICPIAQALERTLGVKVIVGIAVFWLNSRTIDLPPEVRRVTMLLHPKWNEIKPFTFTIHEH